MTQGLNGPFLKKSEKESNVKSFKRKRKIHVKKMNVVKQDLF